MKAVKIRNVVFGEGIPKICIPLTDTDLKGLKQSVKAMKSAPSILLNGVRIFIRILKIRRYDFRPWLIFATS